MNNYVGIDVGGTKIFAIRATTDGKVLKKKERKTEASSGRAKVLQNLFEIIDDVLDKNTKAIGVAWAGMVRDGMVINSPNIPKLNGYKLQEKLERTFDIPVVMDNDARLFALGENKNRNTIGIIMGTGVGSGIVADGFILHGQQGFAGEIGHMYADGIEVEDIFSGRGMRRFLKDQGLPANIGENIKKWRKKEHIAYEAINQLIEKLSVWIYNLVLIFNPEEIVFGGGIGMHVVTHFLPQIRKNVKDKLNKKGFKHQFKIRSSQLENAGALGAVFLAHQNFIKQK